MNAQKLTQKSMEAIREAQSVAVQYQNMQIDQPHLLYALAGQEDGLIGELLTKMGVDTQQVVRACEQAIGRLPRVSGPGRDPEKVYVSPETDAALNEAEQQAAHMQDEYVSVEHLMLGLMERQTARSRKFSISSISKRVNSWRSCSRCGAAPG